MLTCLKMYLERWGCLFHCIVFQTESNKKQHDRFLLSGITNGLQHKHLDYFIIFMISINLTVYDFTYKEWKTRTRLMMSFHLWMKFFLLGQHALQSGNLDEITPSYPLLSHTHKFSLWLINVNFILLKFLAKEQGRVRRYNPKFASKYTEIAIQLA